jgi:PEP-CTERM motif
MQQSLARVSRASARAVLVCVTSLFYAPNVVAQTTCVAGTLASYIALGSNGCTLGAITVSRFFNFDTSDLRSSSIRVTPMTVGDWTGFHVQESLYAFGLREFQTFDGYRFGFSVRGAAVTGMRSTVFGSVFAAPSPFYYAKGSASVEMVRRSSQFVESLGQVVDEIGVGDRSECFELLTSCRSNPPTLTFDPFSAFDIDVFNFVRAGGPNGPNKPNGEAFASMSGSFVELRVVPEPATVWMLGVGVIAVLGTLRLRSRARVI